MFDFSWSELLVVIIVAIIAIGPKQLPEMLYGLGRIVRRLQYMRYALTRQFDDFMDQSDLRQFRDTPPLQNNLNDKIPPEPRVINLQDMDEAEADEAQPLPPEEPAPVSDQKKIGHD